MVDTAVEILDKYGTQTNQVIARQKSDLVTAAAQLSEAVKTLPEMQRSAERLSKLEQQINEISADDDLDSVKARLCAGVAAARAEALQEGHKISELFSGVAGKLDIAPVRGPDQVGNQDAGETPRVAGTVYAPDPLTGLPSRAYAEAELARAHGQSSDCYVGALRGETSRADQREIRLLAGRSGAPESSAPPGAVAAGIQQPHSLGALRVPYCRPSQDHLQGIARESAAHRTHAHDADAGMGRPQRHGAGGYRLPNRIGERFRNTLSELFLRLDTLAAEALSAT